MNSVFSVVRKKMTVAQKHKLIGSAISGAICIAILLFYGLGWFQGIEFKSLDLRFRLRGARAIPDEIKIITIDEESIGELGRWPWPRSIHAKLIDILSTAGAEKIVFDVFFTEAGPPESDQKLIEATRQAGNVFFAMFFERRDVASEKLTLPIPELYNFGEKQPFPWFAYRGVGFANVFPETDGITRKSPLWIEHQGEIYPSLGLAAIREELFGLEKIPVEGPFHELLVNYVGGYESFPSISYIDVLEEKFSPEYFKGKIVLIGATAAGLFDSYATPFSPVLPGVEVHASVMENLLHSSWIRRVPAIFNILGVIGCALLLGWLLPRLTPWKGTFVTIIVLVGIFLTGFLLFKFKNMWWGVTPPLTMGFTGYVGIIFYRFITEEREKKKVKNAFVHYLAREVMEEVLSDPSKLQLGGVRKELTVLFSDIRGFTTLSESSQPEEIVHLLNEYFTAMTDVIFEYGGTLDKFIGDAIMVIYGAPAGQKDHARRAVCTAIEMMKRLQGLREKWKQEGRKTIDIGIGINTGEMVVGNMGSAQRMDYTVIGDNVNLSSRLQGETRHYDAHIIISEATYNLVKDNIDAEFLDRVKVKGKTREVSIYKVRGYK